jgi:phage gp29-like protein
VGTSPDESTRKQREELAQDLYNSGEDAAIILAAGFDLKALQMPAVLPELYSRQIQLAKTAIATRIRGGNLSTEVKGDGGTQAAAKVQRATGDQPKLRWDAQTLSTTVHDQSLVHWAEFNFGDSKLAPWPVWPVEPEEDKKLEAETEEKAFANVEKAEAMGFDVDRKAFLDKYGIEWAKPGTKPEPPKPPTGADPSAVPVPGEPGQAPPAPSKQGAKPEPGARAQGGISARLASGFLAAKASGFLNGQLYADSVVEHATADGEQALQPTLDAVLEELEAATDYDDLRTRLRARYEQLDPTALNELVARAMWLGEMAGRVAVNEDA